MSSVAGTLNASYSYDSNGAMTAGGGRNVAWTSYGMASSINRGSATMCFAYDPEHARVAMEQHSGSDCSATLLQTTTYLSGAGVRSGSE